MFLKVSGYANTGLSEPIELAARTTQTQPERSPVIPEPVPLNELGEYLLPVGPKVRVFPRLNEETIVFRVNLEAGEAYRVLIDNVRVRNLPIRQIGTVNYLVGDLRPYSDTADQLFRRGTHTVPIPNPTHVFWGVDSIRRVSDNRVITFQDTHLEPQFGSTWIPEVFLSTTHVATDGMVFHAPTAGEYTIGLFSHVAGATFGVQVVKVEDQPDVPSFGYALDLYSRVEGTYGIGGTWRHKAVALGNISPGDADWFLVRLEAAKTYDVKIINWPGTRRLPLPSRTRATYVTVPDWQGLGNPQLKFGGRNGVPISGSPSLTVPRDAGGYYHFGVTGGSSTDSGLYVLEITERDFGTTASTALKIGAGQQVIGLIDGNPDRDWIGAWLECGKNYRVKAHGSYGDIGGRDFALTIGLKVAAWDWRGRSVASSAVRRYNGPDGHVHFQTGLYSEIDFDPPCSGDGTWYYFEVGTGSAGVQRRGAYYFQIDER